MGVTFRARVDFCQARRGARFRRGHDGRAVGGTYWAFRQIQSLFADTRLTLFFYNHSRGIDAAHCTPRPRPQLRDNLEGFERFVH
jgi:hypothetical protein